MNIIYDFFSINIALFIGAIFQVGEADKVFWLTNNSSSASWRADAAGVVLSIKKLLAPMGLEQNTWTEFCNKRFTFWGY